MDVSNIIMGFFDLVPCAAFAVASIFMLKLLDKKIEKLPFVFIASGCLLVTLCGTFKATQKILYYLQVCDITIMKDSFMLYQSFGFLFAAAGMFIILFKKNKVATLSIVPFPLLLIGLFNAPEKVNPKMVFVVLLVIGYLGFYFGLIIFASKMKNPWLIVLLSVSVICALVMGYLGSKESVNDWYKEVINTVGQGCFLTAMILFDKFGFATKVNNLSLRK